MAHLRPGHSVPHSAFCDYRFLGSYLKTFLTNEHLLEIYDFPDQNTQMFNNKARHRPVNSVVTTPKHVTSMGKLSMTVSNTMKTISSLFFR